MMGDVTVSGSLAPQQTWSTFKIPVDPATQSLNVTVSHDPSTAAQAIPALDQLYLVGPTGTLLAELTGAAANFQGPRQDVSVGLSRVPSGSNLVVRIVETPIATAPTTDCDRTDCDGTDCDRTDRDRIDCDRTDCDGTALRRHRLRPHRLRPHRLRPHRPRRHQLRQPRLSLRPPPASPSRWRSLAPS